MARGEERRGEARRRSSRAVSCAPVLPDRRFTACISAEPSYVSLGTHPCTGFSTVWLRFALQRLEKLSRATATLLLYLALPLPAAEQLVRSSRGGGRLLLAPYPYPSCFFFFFFFIIFIHSLSLSLWHIINSIKFRRIKHDFLSDNANF